MQYDIDFLRKAKHFEGVDVKAVRKKHKWVLRKEAERELNKLEEEEKRMKELMEKHESAKT